MDKTLLEKSRKRYNGNPTGFILLGVLFCLVVVGSIALNLVIDGLAILGIALIVLPLLCGTMLSAYSVDYFDRLEFKGLLSYSGKYFSPQFYGSFRFIISFLKALAVEIAAGFVVGIISYIVFVNVKPTEFNECIEALLNVISNPESDMDALNSVLIMNDGLLANYFNITQTITSVIGGGVLLLGISYNSLGLYFRTLLNGGNVMFTKRAVIQTLKNKRREIFKDYFSLNWPIVIACILGLVMGSIVSIITPKLLEYSFETTFITAFIFMIPFFPKYLANMTAIFDKYQASIILGVNDSVKSAIYKIQKSVDLSEEDRQKIEETLKQLEDEEKRLKEENKKDSNEES